MRLRIDPDEWPLGRPATASRGDSLKLLPWFEKALEKAQCATMGISPELVDPDFLRPTLEGCVMVMRSLGGAFDSEGKFHIPPPVEVMVLVVIPKGLCVGLQTAICQRLDGMGTSLEAMASWIVNAGIQAGLDPDERVVIATRHELQWE